MTDCCEKTHSGKAQCPACQTQQKQVAIETLLHHIISPLNQLIPPQTYYFCTNHQCEIVYFGNLGAQYSTDQIRGKLGQKQTCLSRTICYCFDITEQRVLDELSETGKSSSKSFVIAQTKAKACACATRNPSGACCLADFPS